MWNNNISIVKPSELLLVIDFLVFEAIAAMYFKDF